MKRHFPRFAVLFAVGAAAFAAMPAQAGGNVQWSVSVGSPGYYAPPPAVVYRYAPPVVVYQQPAPGYYYAPPVSNSIESNFQYGPPPTVYVPPPTVTYVPPQVHHHNHWREHRRVEQYPRQEYRGHSHGQHGGGYGSRHGSGYYSR
ncbi:MAG TPA: hypothetical protein VGU61_11800 [Noviherbaspirillum sp.]|jgi:hypothetical protein|uniref:hypothetical protein n=1 Tax=Noviherbaspirillum sp. TaxID=1926288 RepID=UPI002DDCA9B4|nr:hypothetical protein [Noviherbaspirillum sp.]HEV2610942.1 hypothetical protein [Noviherbaspirillum sp.]